MRGNSLKTLDLILSLSKDEAKISCFLSSLLKMVLPMVRQAHHEGQLVENPQPHPELVEG